MPYQATELDRLVNNNSLVSSLADQLTISAASIGTIPHVLAVVIAEECWQRRWVPQLDGEVTFENFRDFVTTAPFEGLGADPDQLRKLCGKDPEALTLLEGALKGTPGGNGNNQYGKANNISLSTSDDGKKRKHGTARAYLLERLSRERPDLFERVVAEADTNGRGTFTVNKAAIEAGWVKPTFTIPADPEEAAEALMRRFSPKDIARIIAHLCAETDRWPD